MFSESGIWLSRIANRTRKTNIQNTNTNTNQDGRSTRRVSLAWLLDISLRLGDGSSHIARPIRSARSLASRRSVLNRIRIRILYRLREDDLGVPGRVEVVEL